MASTAPPSGGFGRALSIQADVIGALIMRELHTRYGRDNIGYLWLIGEPLLLATIIGLAHSHSSDHFSSDISPMAFGVVGYVIFIIFRGIFNKAEGALESNLPLLYHKTVSIFDIMLAKAVIELAGCFMALTILLAGLYAFGLADATNRPLYLMLAILLMAWMSFAMSLLVVGLTYHAPLMERLVHPFAYMMIPLSGAFWMVGWLPEPFRTWMTWNPFAVIFELARYGQFRSGDDRFLFPLYVMACCAALTYWGLISIRRVRRDVHLG